MTMMENYFHICSKVFHLTKSRRILRTELTHVKIFISSHRQLGKNYFLLCLFTFSLVSSIYILIYIFMQTAWSVSISFLESQPREKSCVWWK